jgi:hypothetical protein
MYNIQDNEYQAIEGGILPLIAFGASFALTYTFAALIDSEATHQGINDGNGNCN